MPSIGSARYLVLLSATVLVSACRREQPPRDTTDAAGAERRAVDRPRADSTPAGVVRRYYGAIQAGDYATAYDLWSSGGEASGKSREDFAAGFANTGRVGVTITDSTRIEGAAGSQYATVPVRVDALLRDGRAQHFTGSYVLRRSMVDGATAEQRRWSIYTARLVER